MSSNSTRFSGGFQQPLGQDWSLAFAIAYEEISQTPIDGNRARSSGQGFTAGLGMERQNADGYNYGFSISGGWTWLETARSVAVFETGRGLSEPQTGHLRFDGHVGNVFRNGAFFAAPSLNAGLTALRHYGLTETGLDGLGVQVVRDTQLIAPLNPVLRLGHVFHESETRTGTVSLTMGARLSSTGRVDIPVRFAGTSVSFGYNAELGDHTKHHRTGPDLRLRF
ncbi:autotransporter domain-containing protein [Maricaulis salignorans]|uniref:autotransporter domain-containing protein n=1 Tax=Maricaulis salignorans TaxID=144026 RepID=UPI003A923913